MKTDHQRIFLSAVILFGDIYIIGHRDIEFTVIEEFFFKKSAEFFSGVPVNVDLIAVGTMFCAAYIYRDIGIQVIFKESLSLLQTDDITTIVFIIGNFSAGDIISHIRVKVRIAESSGIAVRTDTYIKLRLIIQSKKGSETICRNGHFIFFNIGIELDQAFSGCVDS